MHTVHADDARQFNGICFMKPSRVPVLPIAWDELPYLTFDNEPYIDPNAVSMDVPRTRHVPCARAAASACMTERDLVCFERLDDSDSAESSYSSNYRRPVVELQPLRKRSRAVYEALETRGETKNSRCDFARESENWATMDLETLCEDVFPSASIVDAYNWMVDIVEQEVCPSKRWWLQCGKQLIKETEEIGLLYG
jgi:hypothetical protein